MIFAFMFSSFAFAVDQEAGILAQNKGTITEANITSTIDNTGNAVKNIGQNVLNQISSWSLPICAILVVWGAVQYFILGIRNLYKKRQGLLLMWGSITFYVVTLFASVILSFMSGK
jgi:hypothetical protein